jgi:hypothetical protein
MIRALRAELSTRRYISLPNRCALHNVQYEFRFLGQSEGVNDAILRVGSGRYRVACGRA